MEKEYCIIIPTYNNCQTIAKLIEDCLNYCTNVLIVNDGSTDQTSEILQKYTEKAIIISYLQNKGKGFAIKQGFNKAIQLGYKYAITIDSDGQHYPHYISKFIEISQQNKDALVIGARNIYQENKPQKNSFANKFSNFWFNLYTGLALQDTQSGYRLYPLNFVSKTKFFTNHYEFEVEIIIRAAWKNVKIIEIPIEVYYPIESERVSHFKPFRDFTRISILNTILFFITFFYIKPIKFIKALNKQNIKRIIKEEILASKDSNLKIALSVMLGIFFGIAPIWGWQMLVCFAIAHFLKLNKAIALISSNISIPPMIPIIIYASYKTGQFILQNYDNSINFITNLTIEKFNKGFFTYILGSIIFAIVMAIFTAIIVYLLLLIFRKKNNVANNLQ